MSDRPQDIYTRVYDAPVGGEASKIVYKHDEMYFYFISDDGQCYKITVENVTYGA